MSSFFTVPGAAKKRKRTVAPDAPKKRVAAASSGTRQAPSSAKKSNTRTKDASAQKNGRGRKAAPQKPAKGSRRPGGAKDGESDEEVSGSDSDDDDLGNANDDDDLDLDSDADEDSDLDGDEAETAAERRLRLAERYLENVRREVGPTGAAGEDGDIYAFDAEDVDRDLIAERLQEDVAESKGRVYRQLAEELGFAHASHCLVRWNAKNINAVAVCAPYAYTVSSDTCLTKWRIQDRPEEQQKQREAVRQQWAEEKRRKKNKNSRKKKKKTSAEETPAESGDESGKTPKPAPAPAPAPAPISTPSLPSKGAPSAPAPPSVPARRQPQRVLFRRGNPSRRNDKTYQGGHVGAILTVAASQDGKLVVTGGADRRLIVWDAATLRPLRVFTHHRDAVTGLAFRRGTNQLYSCSKDRTIKVWSLDELAYVQTLFGHQDEVVDIDALAQEKCVSVGTRDRTARMWKVIEETQLVFRGGGSGGGDKKSLATTTIDPKSLAHEGSMDRVAMLDDELFVTGSDNGALALWSTQKKKPLFVVPRAHGLDPALTGRELYDRALADPAAQAANPPPPPQPRWITALRTVPYSDVVFSGSWDGCVRVWRLSRDKRKLEAVGTLGNSTDKAASSSLSSAPPLLLPTASSAAASSSPSAISSFSIPGVVNDIAVFERGERGRNGLSVVVAVGQEHRLGRWGRIPSARNGAVVFEIGTAALANGTTDEPANGAVNGRLSNGTA